MSKETYKLSWLQSADDFANVQEVLATVNSLPVTIASAQAMSVSSVQFDFDTDAQVEWWVKTTDDTGSKTVDSAHDTFVAANLAPLKPATSLSHVYVGHIP